MAFNKAKHDAQNEPSYPVPEHLRNAPTSLMKDLGYGAEYRYAHNEEGAFAAGEKYFPEAISDRQYYFPTDRGLEQKIKQKLDYLSQRNEQSDIKRYE